MSSKPTIEPPAVKKRGRPKKVVAEDAGTIPEVAASKAAVKKVAPKTSAKEEVEEVKKEKKVIAKSGKTAAAAAAVGKKDAPQSTIMPEQPTPTTPSTSKILDEVKARRTLKKAQFDQRGEGVKADLEKNNLMPSQTQAPPPQNPASPPSKQATSAIKPPPQTKPPTSSSRTTTIPLPQKPKTAPSPVPIHSSPTKPTPTTTSSSSRARNHYPSIRSPPSQHQHQQQQQQQQTHPPHPRPPYLNERQYPSRIIEPTPDIRLPPKYKPAARRVTAIMVGLPIVLVVGWELLERWRGKDVRQKFLRDREEVLRGGGERREG